MVKFYKILIISTILSLNGFSQNNDSKILYGRKNRFIFIFTQNEVNGKSYLIFNYYNYGHTLVHNENFSNDLNIENIQDSLLKINTYKDGQDIFATYMLNNNKLLKCKMSYISETERINYILNNTYFQDKFDMMAHELDSILGTHNYKKMYDFNLIKKFEKNLNDDVVLFRDRIDNYFKNLSADIIKIENENINKANSIIEDIDSPHFEKYFATIRELPIDRDYYINILYQVCKGNPILLINYLEENPQQKDEILDAIWYQQDSDKRRNMFKIIEELNTDSKIKDEILKYRRSQNRIYSLGILSSIVSMTVLTLLIVAII